MSAARPTSAILAGPSLASSTLLDFRSRCATLQQRRSVTTAPREQGPLSAHQAQAACESPRMLLAHVAVRMRCRVTTQPALLSTSPGSSGTLSWGCHDKCLREGFTCD